MKSFLPYISLLLGTGNAAPVVSAQSIIVNPAPTALKVNVRTNRDAGGQGTPTYGLRDRLEVYTRVNGDAHVYLFNVDPAGRVSLLAPGSGNFVKANTTLVLPRKGEPSPYIRAGSVGVNRVLVLASLTPLDTGKLGVSGQGFGGFTALNVRGEAELAQALSALLAPLKSESWTTDTVRYQIQEPGFMAREYRRTFESRGSLRDVYSEFSDRLRAEGYGQITVRYGKNEAQGVFGRSGGQQKNAVLELRQKGRVFEVKIQRK